MHGLLDALLVIGIVIGALIVIGLGAGIVTHIRASNLGMRILREAVENGDVEIETPDSDTDRWWERP